MRIKITSLLLFLCFCALSQINSQTTSLIAYDTSGKLAYLKDSKGNQLPDFSYVGYKNSEVAIPTVAVVKTVYPVAGDNLANIQNAINQVAAMPVGSDGFRGAILFKKGLYQVSDTIQIKTSGIVLRGEGTDTINGTRFLATTLAQYTLFNFQGKSGIAATGTKRATLDPYIPYGTNKLTVTNASSTFKVGDSILVERLPDSNWINLLTMAQWGWTPSGYNVYFQRKITAISGTSVTVDAPFVDNIDTNYAVGSVMKYKSPSLQNCGIENMALLSAYTSDTAENHGWDAIEIDNAINCWVRKVEVYYFGYSAVTMHANSCWITVDSCKMIDAKSVVTGERRYSFHVDGQHTLVKNCWTRNGRHDYVTGGRVAGPNVFYNSTATKQQNDIGPHMRWSTGILFDNITSNGNQNVQNRESMGTGHGWSGGQIMYWNCKAGSMIIQDPQGDETNWAIGCTSPNITNVGGLATEPYGVVESKNKPIAAIPSLFMAQLNQRLAIGKKKVQTIKFDSLAAKNVGDSDFVPTCSASSTLPITLTSMNKSVATIVNGKIHIVGIGTVIINASQIGDTNYLAAPIYGQLLTVNASLPIGIKNFSATIKSKSVVLNWDISDETGIAKYQIEKSKDGNSFIAIGFISSIIPQKNMFSDVSPSLPAYYRIKAVYNNGVVTYSNSLFISDKSTDGISIYPNPVTNNLMITGLNGQSTLKIVNSIGQIMRQQNTSANALNLDVSTLKEGVYILSISDDSDRIIIRKFIKK